MKALFAFLNNPLVVFTHSLIGGALIAYVQDVAIEALYWFIPCCFIIIADLISGINAAKHREEEVRISGAMRRTINKTVCYLAWIIVCVTLNERYETEWIGRIGMSLVFLIEGTSCISNWLEPHGYTISLKGILHTVGERHNLDQLENVVEKKPKKKSNGSKGKAKV